MNLAPKSEAAELKVEELAELNQARRRLTAAVIKNSVDAGDNQKEGAASPSKAANIDSNIQDLQKALLELRGRVLARENNDKDRDSIPKEASISDKALIKLEFRALADNDQAVHTYCKNFYWTLLNYMTAYRSVFANVSEKNHALEQAKMEKYFEAGIKVGAGVAKALMSGVPFAGEAISMIDRLITSIYLKKRNARFDGKTAVIRRLTTFNNDPNVQTDDDLSMACALVAISIATSKRAEIHKLSVPINPTKLFTEKCGGFVKENVELLKSVVIPSANMEESKEAELAVSDVALLLTDVCVNHEQVMAEKKPLYKTFQEIVLDKEHERMIEQIMLEERAKNMKKMKMESGPNSKSDSKKECNIF